MRLLVYNIAYGTGSPRTALELLGNAPSYLRTSDRYFRAIGHLVRHFSPDVAGFLEIDKGSFRTRGVSQTAQLAELLQNRGITDTDFLVTHDRSRSQENSVAFYTPQGYCKLTHKVWQLLCHVRRHPNAAPRGLKQRCEVKFYEKNYRHLAK